MDLGLAVIADSIIKLCKIVKAGGGGRVFWAERFLAKRQNLDCNWNSFGIFAGLIKLDDLPIEFIRLRLCWRRRSRVLE